MELSKYRKNKILKIKYRNKNIEIKIKFLKLSLEK
jgi:hypothetical protein